MAEPDPPTQTATERRGKLMLGRRSLREHTARGTIVNAVFSVGLAGLGLARNFLIAIFLTAAEYGLWGLIFIAVTAVLWFMEIGIGDKFIQQDEEDQEVAFQKAFTLNLLWTLLFCVLILVTVPLFSLLYGRPEIILPGCLLAFGVFANTFRTPTWIFYREMQFVRQRALLALEPVVGFIVTIALGFSGAGYWSLVIGVICGMWAAGIAALVFSPYKIRLRYESFALREYFSFGWPILISSGSGIMVVQLAVILGEQTAGLAGVGAIGLAGTIAAFTDRVDQIVTQTIYPAVCAVRDRRDLLFESFTKSNRLALIWGVPSGIGLTLFAPDLVKYVLGERWDVATGLLQVFGLTAAVKQIGFNWSAFQRALGETKPLAAYGISALIVFLVVGVPGMIAWGITGYAVAICAITVVQLAVRTYFLRKLFAGFDMVRHTLRALTPSVPAVGVVLAMRLIEPTTRTDSLVVAEIVAYVVVTGLATWAAERTLLRELFGYLRRGSGATQPA